MKTCIGFDCEGRDVDTMTVMDNGDALQRCGSCLLMWVLPHDGSVAVVIADDVFTDEPDYIKGGNTYANVSFLR